MQSNIFVIHTVREIFKCKKIENHNVNVDGVFSEIWQRTKGIIFEYEYTDKSLIFPKKKKKIAIEVRFKNC